MSDVQYTSWRSLVEEHFIIMPQIESKVGLANVEAIAAHEVVTAIAIGPYDLSAELGVCWDPSSPVLQDAVQKIRAAGKKAGKTMWHFDANVTNFVCVGEPGYMLMDAFKSARAEAEATQRASQGGGIWGPGGGEKK